MKKNKKNVYSTVRSELAQLAWKRQGAGSHISKKDKLALRKGKEAQKVKKEMKSFL